jgi:4-carboxymuconolactone decarboxylase
VSRLEPLDIDNLSGEQKRVADEIRSGPRGGLRGPFEAWLRSPGLAEHAQKVGAYVRFGSSLPPDLNEMAILLTGKHWRAQFEFWAHSRLAREAGLDEGIIEAIRTGELPRFTREAEHIVYDFVTEYFTTNRVSASTYNRAVDAFGENGVVDLVGAVGYYSLVSMTLNVFEVGLPEGVEAPLG